MLSKAILKIIVLCIIVLIAPSCAFIPQTVTTTKHNNKACTTASSEWVIKVVTFSDSNLRCDDNACLMLITGVPVVTAVLSLPVVVIGNVINYVEKVIRCD